MWFKGLPRWIHLVLRSRPRYPMLPGSESDMSYDLYRDPEDTPGIPAVAVVNPDGTRITKHIEDRLDEILLELRRLRVASSLDIDYDLEKIS